jgi:hypothetical protein
MEKKKGLIQTAILTGVGLIGGLLGSSYQQYLSAKLERQKSFDSWRREAYVSYLSGMEKLRISQDQEEAAREFKANTPEQRRLKAKAEQLRDEWEYEASTGARKIGIFGNTTVVEAIAKHWRETSEDRRCGRGWKTDLAIFRAMREQAVPNERRVSDDDLAQVTMQCTPPKE